MRKIEMEIEIAATPEEVWEALSTAQGITSWFCPIASVEPGVGGTVVKSFGPGMEAASTIEVWEPGRHFRAGPMPGEAAQPTVVDYYIEGRGGTTVMRLVQSGFEEKADFDSEFDSYGSAWPLFLKMLKHSVERGVSVCRNVTIFRMLEESQESAWKKLSESDAWRAETQGGIELHSNGKGIYGLEFPELGGAMMSVFCESCGSSAMLTLVWLLYDVTEKQADTVRDCWTANVNRLFGEEKCAVAS